MPAVVVVAWLLTGGCGGERPAPAAATVSTTPEAVAVEPLSETADSWVRDDRLPLTSALPTLDLAVDLPANTKLSEKSALGAYQAWNESLGFVVDFDYAGTEAAPTFVASATVEDDVERAEQSLGATITQAERLDDGWRLGFRTDDGFFGGLVQRTIGGNIIRCATTAGTEELRDMALASCMSLRTATDVDARPDAPVESAPRVVRCPDAFGEMGEYERVRFPLPKGQTTGSPIVQFHPDLVGPYAGGMRLHSCDGSADGALSMVTVRSFDDDPETSLVELRDEVLADEYEHRINSYGTAPEVLESVHDDQARTLMATAEVAGADGWAHDRIVLKLSVAHGRIFAVLVAAPVEDWSIVEESVHALVANMEFLRPEWDQ